MAGSVPQKITAWSYSRYSVYEDCPFKAKCKFVDKLQEPGSSAMDRGSAMHSNAELTITGKMSPKQEDIDKAKAFLPEFKDKILPVFKGDFTTAKKGKPQAEQEWAFRSDWSDTSWFAKDAWCRVKTDLVFWRKTELIIVDHKTGKRREGHKTQLSLYALAGFLKFPKIDHISSELWYLDQGKPHTNESYERDELPHMIEAWEERTHPMLNDTTFVPKPSHGCTWCHFRKENGGPCKF